MLIRNATIVNEGERFRGSVLVEGERIAAVIRDGEAMPMSSNAASNGLGDSESDEVIDAEGMFLLPGVIDDHVHMRDPGLTHKATMDSETQAAAAGGVTSVMDMPNVVPQTTTIDLWQSRMDYAAQHCHVNYAFYLGATNDNLCEIRKIDPKRVPALKVFMGSSTGGMLVDRETVLREIFAQCPTLIMAHCEDTARINERMKEAQTLWGDDPGVEHHSWIRDAEACYRSSALAVRLAEKTGARLHIAHITTRKELSLLPRWGSMQNCKAGSGVSLPAITAEVCPQHLFFTDSCYETKHALIKCNPSIKSEDDRIALCEALRDGLLNIVGTDHAPHLLSEKAGGARTAVSGLPMVQFSLPLMLTLSADGLCSVERIVEVMCHNPASLFGVRERGFIRRGYKADLVLVRPEEYVVCPDEVLSKCAWTPLDGVKLKFKVMRTIVNGRRVFDWEKGVDTRVLGQALEFA